MRYFTRTGYSIILMFCLTLLAGRVQAQDNTPYPWQLGLGIGYTNYYGDVSHYRINGFKDFDKLYHFAEYNKYYQHQPSFSLLLHKKLTPTLGLMFQVNHLQFEMSDRYRKSDGIFDTGLPNYARSLNFRTRLQDAGIAFSFNANNGRPFSENAFFYPSFFIGAGVSSFTVKGDLYDDKGSRYNYRLPGNLTDGSFETNLRDLRTETEKKYRNVEPYADLGLGLNFRFSQFITLSVQSDIKFSASDYLDDVSAKYKNTYPTPEEGYAARPGYNTVNPVTLSRGDDNGINDFYINNRAVLNIALKRKARPEVFMPPVIYTLGMPDDYRKKQADTLARKMAMRSDSLAKLRTDSVVKVKTDSMRSVQDSIVHRTATAGMYDSGMQQQLQTITAELNAIKAMLQSQGMKPRYQQLQSQVDSLTASRNRLQLQRTLSREDNFRLRIYNLQLDSLHNEMQRLQYDQRYPGKADSSWDSPYRPNNRVAADVSESMRENNMAAAVESDAIAEKSDSISEADLKSIDNDIRNLKKDKRYKSDSVFTTNVDALQNKVKTYPVKPVKTANPKVQAQPRQRVQKDTVTYTTEQRKIDSLQRRLDELDNKTGNKPVEQIVTDTVVKVVTDTVKDERGLEQLQSNLRSNADSIAMLQRRLQRSNDSAAYYRRAAFAASDNVQVNAEEAPKKKKWYQMFFSSGKNNKKKVDTIVVKPVPQTQPAQRVATDTVISRQAAIAPEAEVQTEQAPKKKKWYQTLFSSGKDSKKKVDTVVVKPVTQKQPVQRMAKDTVISRQVAIAPEAELQTEKTSKKKNKKTTVQSSETTSVASAPQQQYYNNQEQYYNKQIGQMEQSIADLNRKNRELTDDYDRLRSDRDRNRNNPSPTPVVVYDRNNRDLNNRDVYESSRIADRNYNDIASLRAEVQRLQNRENVTGVNNYGDNGITGNNRQPVRDTATAVMPADTAQLNALRHEIEQLRAEMNALRTTKPPVADTVTRTEHAFDAGSFPVTSVYFKSGAVSLTADQLSKLAPFAQVAAKNKEAGILLKGFSDPVGNAAANKLLANKRMAYVKNLLLTRYGIEEKRILSDEPSVAEGGKVKKPNPLDRRVDLEFK